MTLVTTGQRKGADAIAAAWAARPENSVPLVAYGLYGSGRKTAFNRNRKLAELKHVAALLCEGSGLQANRYQLLRKAGVPVPAFQKPDGVARTAAQRGSGLHLPAWRPGRCTTRIGGPSRRAAARGKRSRCP